MQFGQERNMNVFKVAHEENTEKDMDQPKTIEESYPLVSPPSWTAD